MCLLPPQANRGVGSENDYTALRTAHSQLGRNPGKKKNILQEHNIEMRHTDLLFCIFITVQTPKTCTEDGRQTLI